MWKSTRSEARWVIQYKWFTFFVWNSGYILENNWHCSILDSKMLWSCPLSLGRALLCNTPPHYFGRRKLWSVRLCLNLRAWYWSQWPMWRTRYPLGSGLRNYSPICFLFIYKLWTKSFLIGSLLNFFEIAFYF